MSTLTDIQQAFAVKQFKEERDIRFMEINLIIGAIFAASSGKTDNLVELQREYRNLIYPDSTETNAQRAERIAKLLKEEHDAGEIKFVAPKVNTKKKNSKAR